MLLTAAFSPTAAQGEAAELEDLIGEYVRNRDPGVVVLVSTAEGDMWSAAVGLADLDAGTPIRTDDHVRIGSVTKPFVAVVLLQLAEEGVLDLDDRMAEWVSQEVSENITNGDEITLRQLMNMTSGVFDYTGSNRYYAEVERNPDRIWAPAETVSFAFGRNASFAPGESYEYSNTNYILLQLVIENATGRSLGEVLKTRIFDPLGMTETRLEDSGIDPELVRGYDDWDGDGRIEDVTDINDSLGLGDGGIVSTAADLETFARALFESDLLSEDSLDEMMTLTEFDDYGLGITYYETNTDDAWGHDGATVGFLASMYYLEDSGVVVVMWSNDFTSELLDPLWWDVLDVLGV